MGLVKDIQMAIEYIEENITGELSHEEIAGSIFISKYHLRRVFPMVCDITLGEYIRNRKLSLSVGDITDTDTSILDIALKYGYSTPESYTRAFYRFYGKTPSVVRNRKIKLDLFEKISVQKLLKGDLAKMEELTKRDYTVVNSKVVYYTKDMDKTAKWFKDVLGWYAGVETRDENGVAVYGSALPFPGELVHMKVAEFNGLLLLNGEPTKKGIAFIKVSGIDALHSFVKTNGWDEITEIEEKPWGAKVCKITTIDDTILIFHESE